MKIKIQLQPVILTSLLFLLPILQAAAFNYGDRVQCTVNLNVRATASTSGTFITTETSGSKGTIESGTSQSANGYTWWYITWDNGYTGWSVDSLQLVAATPPTHGVASQVRADTGVAMSDPATLPQGVGVYFRVTPTDPQGSTVKMEVELHQLPATFTGTANYVSSYVTSGTVATTPTATGLAAGNYGWAYRVVDSQGLASAWVAANNPDFTVQAASQPPTHGVASQVRADTGVAMSDPATLPQGVGVYFRVTPTDPQGSTVKMEVELHQLPATFTGTANYVSSYVTSGTVATTPTATGLAAGNYGWAYRVVDSQGLASAWVAANNPDFTVQAVNVSPSITSVNPNPVIGSDNHQPFTIFGSNFVSNCNVTLRDLTAGQTFTNRAISSFSSTAITINPDFTTAADNWSVEIINPDGQSSGQYPFTVQGSTTAGFYLGFPLSGQTAYTASINSVFDHSMSSSYTVDDIVVAYDGERGERAFGWDGSSSPGYKNSAGTNFSVNGQYTGAGELNFLNYDGHPGYDYRASRGTSAYAAADGYVHYPASFPGVNNGATFHAMAIDHGNGYITYYLHMTNYPTLGNTVVAENQLVHRGDLVGYVSDAGVPGSPHLHFEVQLNGVPVDPYGWKGSGADPYTRALNVNLWTAPTGTPPSITSVSPNPVTGAPLPGRVTLTLSGANFISGLSVFVTWTGGSKTLDATNVNVISSTEVQISVATDVVADNWTVQVTNPNSQQSNIANFQVVPPSSGVLPLGIDVSSYQGTVNWSQVVGSGGKAFALIRATAGINTTDSQFAQSIVAAKNAGLLVGAWHFAYPQYFTAHQEAQKFLSVAGSYIGAGYLPPALDIEDSPSEDSYPYQMGNAALSQWIRDWCAEIQQAAGVKPMVYAIRYYAQNYFETDINQFPYWVVTDSGLPDTNPGNMGIWSTWTFQQYRYGNSGGTCPGVTGPVDLDSFNGNLAALETLTNRTIVPVNPPSFGGSIISGGKLQTTLSGLLVGESVVIEASTDLRTWTPVQTNSVNGSSMTVTNSISPGAKVQFFRTRVQ